MTLHAGQSNAYGTANAAIGTPRSIEYGVFSRVTGQIKRATGDDRAFSELVAALHDNQRLWTALTADLAASGNALPPALRGQLISLAKFTRDHTAKVLRGKADAAVLVEINTAIMRGLRGTGAAEDGT